MLLNARDQDEKETGNRKQEANLVQITDDEPVLLLSKLDENKRQMVLLNEENVIPKLEQVEIKRNFLNCGIWTMELVII